LSRAILHGFAWGITLAYFSNEVARKQKSDHAIDIDTSDRFYFCTGMGWEYAMIASVSIAARDSFISFFFP